jgi:prepilin peptidase CpaA
MTDPLLCVPLAVLGIATAFDLMRREIPDALSALLLAWAATATAFGWHEVGWLELLGGLAAGFAVSLIGFAAGALGGGDVKILAALGACLGLGRLLPALFWVAVAGGALGVVAKLREQKELAYLPAILLGLLLFTLVGGPRDAFGL